MKNIHICRTL